MQNDIIYKVITHVGHQISRSYLRSTISRKIKNMVDLEASLIRPSNMKSSCLIFIHTQHLLLNMNTGYILAVIKTIKKEINLLKVCMRIQWYTATDFQGSAKMTIKIKTAYFSMFRSVFQKIL